MDDKNVLENINFIFKDVFGRDNPFSIEQLIQRFCKDIPLPKQSKCVMTGAETWGPPMDSLLKVINRDAVTAKFGIQEWSKPKKPINSMDDILKYWQEVDLHSGNKSRGSVAVEKSDEIMDSSNIYMSELIGNSKQIYLSYNDFNCSHLVATRGNNSCSLGIRMLESIYSSSSFDAYHCNKVSKSLIVTECFDLYECMFCFNLSSKKYCICNMQFEPAEYMKLKPLVIEWIFNNYGLKAS